jgi:hypothetical protein
MRYSPTVMTRPHGPSPVSHLGTITLKIVLNVQIRRNVQVHD